MNSIRRSSFCGSSKTTEKILFASDSPWSNAKMEIEHLKALPLSDTEKDMILGLNAARVLNI
ncbi:MAG: amidohydrolase family protein [Clostridiales bacterium]|nr:amidohydrolase family protein [Clostridiales bacterium]